MRDLRGREKYLSENDGGQKKKKKRDVLSWTETNWSRIREDYKETHTKIIQKTPSTSLVAMAILCCATVHEQQGKGKYHQLLA